MQLIKGNIFATLNGSNGMVVLPHIINGVGGFGGFAGILGKMIPVVFHRYVEFFRGGKAVLGAVDFIQVDKELVVANMVGQFDVISKQNIHPIDYTALEVCMVKVQQFVLLNKAKIVTIPFGTALAGGDWKTIKEMMIRIWESQGIDVVVYDNQPISVFDQE